MVLIYGAWTLKNNSILQLRATWHPKNGEAGGPWLLWNSDLQRGRTPEQVRTLFLLHLLVFSSLRSLSVCGWEYQGCLFHHTYRLLCLHSLSFMGYLLRLYLFICLLTWLSGVLNNIMIRHLYLSRSDNPNTYTHIYMVYIYVFKWLLLVIVFDFCILEMF